MVKHDKTKTKIYGNTYNYRSFIKMINGCTWCPEDKTWLIPTLLVPDLIKIFNDNKIEFEQQIEQV